MGARQSKRSVDITTTPKKEGAPAEGGVAGDAAAPGDGKLERIEETDSKPITVNGLAPHTENVEDKDKDEATEKNKDKVEEESKETKAEETKPAETPEENPAEGGKVTTPTENAPTSPTTATSPETKETKKKEKLKKKWSFRSISFGKKDKPKPSREDAPKNGDVTKEEPLTEGGEEAENGVSSPSEEKSSASSPAENESGAATAVEAKEEEKVEPTVNGSVEEKKEEPTPTAPSPVPVEDKKEEIEKESTEKAVEVSHTGQAIAEPVEVTISQVQAIATPSIIERKTSEDIPSHLPSSPPPTPIDPSPLQQARQTASASALAEALKLPAAEAAEKASSLLSSSLLSKENENVSISPDSFPKDTQKQTLEHPTETQETSFTKESVKLDRVSRPSMESEEPFVKEESVAKETAQVPQATCSQSPAVECRKDDGVCEKEKPEVPVVEKLPEKLVQEKLISMETAPCPEKDPEEVEAAKSEGDSIVKEEIKIEGELAEIPPGVEIISDVPEVVEADDVAESREEVVEMEELVIDSEEGPLPVSDEVVVEAKPAVVVPEEEIEIEEADTEGSSTVPSEAIEPEVVVEDETEKTEEESLYEKVEEIVEPEVISLSEETVDPSDPSEPTMETIVITEKEAVKEVIDILDITDDDIPPPPLPDSPIPTKDESSELNFTTSSVNETTVVTASPEVPKVFDTVDSSKTSSACFSGEGILASDESLLNVDQSIDNSLGSPKVTETLPSPPRSPSPSSLSSSDKTASKELYDDEQSNREFKTESVSLSLNSYNTSEVELKDRIAESLTQCENQDVLLSKDTSDPLENEQKKAAAPVVTAPITNGTENGTTEEEEKLAPPTIPKDVPASPKAAIIDDVAVVTKAIEDIEINEKAVAAAVNDAIESANATEIIADACHNNTNE